MAAPPARIGKTTGKKMLPTARFVAIMDKMPKRVNATKRKMAKGLINRTSEL